MGKSVVFINITMDTHPWPPITKKILIHRRRDDETEQQEQRCFTGDWGRGGPELGDCSAETETAARQGVTTGVSLRRKIPVR